MVKKIVTATSCNFLVYDLVHWDTLAILMGRFKYLLLLWLNKLILLE